MESIRGFEFVDSLPVRQAAIATILGGVPLPRYVLSVHSYGTESEPGFGDLIAHSVERLPNAYGPPHRERMRCVEGTKAYVKWKQGHDQQPADASR